MCPLKADGSEPTVLAEVNTSCRITSLSVWMNKVLPVGVNIKPDETETAVESTTTEALPPRAKILKTAQSPDDDVSSVDKNSSVEVTSSTTLKPRAKILKPPRQPGQDGISIVKSSSGDFISEPIVKRKNNRKLSFAADVV